MPCKPLGIWEFTSARAISVKVWASRATKQSGTSFLTSVTVNITIPSSSTPAELGLGMNTASLGNWYSVSRQTFVSPVSTSILHTCLNER